MKVLPILTLMLLGATIATASMEVTLRSRWNEDADIEVATTQRCYTLDDTWSDVASGASWKGLPSASRVAFYKGGECTGSSVTGKTSFSGSIAFESDLYWSVSSFMVQQSSIYPTSGFMHVSEVIMADIWGGHAKLERASASGSTGDVDAGTI